jgi:hypothetical protein
MGEDVAMDGPGHTFREAAPTADAPPQPARADARAALAGFVAVEAIALPLLLWWGRGGWFTFDDWDLLSQRTAGSVHDLFLPHGDHWSTLPVLVYRLFWWAFGIRTYFPWQLLVVLLHLTAVALIRAVMRRAGCAPWIATIFAGTFVFFGVAADTILVGFFMTFIGSLVFGLAHLLLADHDGPADRRDGLGLLAGLAGMLFSGVAVTMVVVVGLAVLARRGWRVALLHTVPLGALYLVWLAAIGTEGGRLPLTRPTASEAARFVAVGLRATFGGLGQLPGVGLALAVMLIAGLVIARAALGPSFRSRAAMPLALLAGAVIFLGITGYGRAGQLLFFGGSGPEHARDSRYVYLVAAMTLPAIALAADAIIRRWRILVPLVLVLPILGLPGNVHKLAEFRDSYKSSNITRQNILIAPRVPFAPVLPRSVQPDSFHAPGLTLGWLIDGVRSGRVPAPKSPTRAEFATTTLKLALATTTHVRVDPCVSLRGPTERVLRNGESITLARGNATIVYLPPSSPPSRPLRFNKSLTGPLTMVALAGPLRLRITPNPSDNRLCG